MPISRVRDHAPMAGVVLVRAEHAAERLSDRILAAFVRPARAVVVSRWGRQPGPSLRMAYRKVCNLNLPQFFLRDPERPPPQRPALRPSVITNTSPATVSNVRTAPDSSRHRLPFRCTTTPVVPHGL